MGFINRMEHLMGMSDAVWLRHANPLSVWTRFSCLPLLALAVWSRVWFGWAAIPLIMLALWWIWANPRAFSVPLDFGSWASRVTLGERVYLVRDQYDIPAHHLRATAILAALPVLGLLPFVWGLWALDFWAVVAGAALLVLPKVWFCDRMVWIHAELTQTTPGDRLPDPRMPEKRMM